MIMSLPKSILGRQPRRRWLLDTPGLGMSAAVILSGALLLDRANLGQETTEEPTTEEVARPEAANQEEASPNEDKDMGPIAVDVVEFTLPELQVATVPDPLPELETAPSALAPLSYERVLLEADPPEAPLASMVEPLPDEQDTSKMEPAADGLSGPDANEGEAFPALLLVGANDPVVVEDWFQAGFVVLDITVQDVGNLIAFVEDGQIRVVRPAKLASDLRSPLALQAGFAIEGFAGLNRAMLEAGFRPDIDVVVTVKLSNPTAVAIHDIVTGAIPKNLSKDGKATGLQALACLPRSEGQPSIVSIHDAAGRLVVSGAGDCPI
jgi:hypothetical protein